MRETEILRLHDAGLCTAAIAMRTGLDLAVVRATLGKQIVDRHSDTNPKAHQAAVEASRKQRKAAAIQKRDKALAAIAALQAQLDADTPL